MSIDLYIPMFDVKHIVIVALNRIYNLYDLLIMFNVKHQTKKVGDQGEKIAQEYLIKNGYKILFRNYKTKLGEIDIITKKSGKITFIEVKTLQLENSGNKHDNGKNNSGIGIFKPEDHFNYKKSKKVSILAEMFAGKHPNLIKDDIGYQIDLIAVTLLAGKQFNLSHYENV